MRKSPGIFFVYKIFDERVIIMSVETILEILPKKNVINLMYTALDEMRSYNGKSITECLVLAMGGEYVYDDEKETYKYRLPNYDVIFKNTM